jgi:biopolymer transport protein ExbB/TolQ
MYPILALLVVALTFIFERLFVLLKERLRARPLKFADTFSMLLEKNGGDKSKTAEQMLANLEKGNTICARVLQQVFLKFKDGMNKGMGPSEIKRWMSEAAENQSAIETPELDAHLGYLAVISNVATLMGLFGTVYGMIEAFTAMSTSVGGVKADEMAGGIAIALVATLFGLTVAVPSLILYNVLKVQMEGYVQQTQEAAIRIIDVLAE